MQIAVFGSTGEAGRLTVREALARGHDVVAYARSPRKLDALAHDRLRVVEGELSDRAAIGRAVDGADAVVSLLGPTGRGSGGHPITAGTLHVVDAMREHGVHRLVATATPSYRVAQDGEALPFRLAVAVVKRLIPDAYADIVGTGAAVAESGLDWTLARLPMLTSKPPRRPLHVGHVGDPDVRLFWLSRSSLASFRVSAVEDGGYVSEAPVLST